LKHLFLIILFIITIFNIIEISGQQYDKYFVLTAVHPSEMRIGDKTVSITVGKIHMSPYPMEVTMVNGSWAWRYGYKSVVTVQAVVVNPNYSFDRWEIDGHEIPNKYQTIEINMDKNHTVKAYFIILYTFAQNKDLGSGTARTIDVNYKVAQTFTSPPRDHFVTHVKVFMKGLSPNGVFQVTINELDEEGNPADALTSGIMEADAILGSPYWYTISVAPQLLEANKEYAIVGSCDTPSNHPVIPLYTTGNKYEYGVMKFCPNGESWMTDSDYDWSFAIQANTDDIPEFPEYLVLVTLVLPILILLYLSRSSVRGCNIEKGHNKSYTPLE
jgi:hypothetical protein